MGETTATAAVEGHAAALVIPATIVVASVESVLPAAIVGATTITAGLSLLDLVLLLATLAALCSMPLVGLLWVLKHAYRGLGAKCIAEHLDLPLNSIDGVIVVALAFLRGSICPRQSWKQRWSGSWLMDLPLRRACHSCVVRPGWLGRTQH